MTDADKSNTPQDSARSETDALGDELKAAQELIAAYYNQSDENLARMLAMQANGPAISELTKQSEGALADLQAAISDGMGGKVNLIELVMQKLELINGQGGLGSPGNPGHPSAETMTEYPNDAAHAPDDRSPEHTAQQETPEHSQPQPQPQPQPPVHSVDSDDASPGPYRASWRISLHCQDGVETAVNGPLAPDDPQSDVLSTLTGKAGRNNSDTDWTIALTRHDPRDHGDLPPCTMIGAKLTARDIPDTLESWRLRIGATGKTGTADTTDTTDRTNETHCELAVSMPAAIPSQLQATLFHNPSGLDAPADIPPAPSCLPLPGGNDVALKLDQQIGTPTHEAVTNSAKIRFVFADRTAIPVELDHVGALPSPILHGCLPTGTGGRLPFWMQITAPAEGKAGANLNIVVQYDPGTSLTVTARLVSANIRTTPTAILSCRPESDSNECRAASMAANANGRLETNLTGVVTPPDDTALARYGFVGPATLRPQNTKDDSASSAAPAATGSPQKGKSPAKPAASGPRSRGKRSTTPSQGTNKGGS